MNDKQSCLMKQGLEKAPHRSLLYALGLTKEEISRPLIGVVNSANEIVPGHMHLDRIAEAVKAGIRMAGGTRSSSRRSASATVSRWGMKA